jgi:hypothetical protein
LRRGVFGGRRGVICKGGDGSGGGSRGYFLLPAVCKLMETFEEFGGGERKRIDRFEAEVFSDSRRLGGEVHQGERAVESLCEEGGEPAIFVGIR